jgi:hypothetical protein
VIIKLEFNHLTVIEQRDNERASLTASYTVFNVHLATRGGGGRSAIVITEEGASLTASYTVASFTASYTCNMCNMCNTCDSCG